MTRRDFLITSSAFLTGTVVGEPVRSVIGGRPVYSNEEDLPYDSDIEYLESTGTQWINTGVYLTVKSRIHLWASVQDGYENLALFGACNGAAYNNGEICNFVAGPTLPGRLTVVYPTSNTSSDILSRSNRPQYSVGELLEITYDRTGYTINGVTYACQWASNYRGNRPCALFAVNRSGGNGQYRSKIRVYRFLVEEDGVALCDLRPVRITNQNGITEGVMYDSVTGGFYYNMGSGAFIVGPDI